MVLTQQRQAEPDHEAPPQLQLVGSAGPAAFAARHADGLAVLAVLAISLASAAWFTRSFYYFQDDFIFIRQAQNRVCH